MCGLTKAPQPLPECVNINLRREIDCPDLEKAYSGLLSANEFSALPADIRNNQENAVNM